MSTKKKIEMAMGKTFLVILRLPVTWSAKFSPPSRIISKTCWSLPGTFFMFARMATEKATITSTATQLVMSELVMGNP